MTTKTFRCTVERLERGTAILQLGGKELAFPRTSLPSPLAEGDRLFFEVKLDASRATRIEAEDLEDAVVGKRVGARVKGNPLSNSTRLKKK